MGSKPTFFLFRKQFCCLLQSAPPPHRPSFVISFRRVSGYLFAAKTEWDLYQLSSLFPTSTRGRRPGTPVKAAGGGPADSLSGDMALDHGGHWRATPYELREDTVQAWSSSLLSTPATVLHKSAKFSVNGFVATKHLEVRVSLHFRRKRLSIMLINVSTLHMNMVWVGA